MLLVYGGSFNPPTIIHKEIAKMLMEKYNADLLFVPVGNSYKKESLIEFEHRFNMIKIIAGKLGAEVTDIESNQKFLGTYDLLKKLDRKDIYFILGADNLVNFDKWINFKKLISEFKFIILNRDKIDCMKLIENLGYKDRFIIEEIGKNNVSSTMYRLNKDESVLDIDVLEYIKENKLYEVK